MDKTVHTFEHNDGPAPPVPVNICLLYHDSLCNIRWGKSARNRAGWMGGMDGAAGGMAGTAGMAGMAGMIGIVGMVSDNKNV